MTDVNLWIIGWAAGGAAVVIAALLLIAIIATAYGIQRQAARSLAALRKIEANTKAIWVLGRTTKRFNAIRDFCEALEDRMAEIGAAADRRGAGGGKP